MIVSAKPLRTFVAQHPLLVAVAAAIGVTLWRAILMLGPSQGTGPAMAIHFVVLAVTPFVFLRPDGRRAIGWSWRATAVWAAVAVLSGIAAAMLIGGVGVWLYGASPLNWFVTVRESMLSDTRLSGLDPLPLFLALATPAALFSPVGEELFFRGVLARLFSAAAGPAAASAITAAVFGLMHAFHHGVGLGPNGPDILPISGAIWVAFTAALSLLFSWLRDRSGSIWYAVFCHAAFNVAMVAFIIGVLR